MATFSQKAKLLKGLLSGRTAISGPFYVDVDLTSRCNLRCTGCPYHSPYLTTTTTHKSEIKDLPLDLYSHLCDLLKEMDTNTLILQGSGEPLLHPHIYEMISIAKRAGLQVVLLTNGTLLNRETVQALIDSNLDTLKISMWANSSEQYQLNYPDVDPRYFNKVLDGLKLLKTLKADGNHSLPRVIIYHVINGFNYQSLDDMVELASRMGCDGLYFSPMVNYQEELSSFTLSEDEETAVKRSLSRVQKRLESLSMEDNIAWCLTRYRSADPLWKTIPCYAAWFHARIRVDGAVQPCGRCSNELIFGNLHDQSFEEIWNGRLIRDFRRMIMTRKGLASLSDKCDCAGCCFSWDNKVIHKYFRWFQPFVRVAKKMSQ